MKKRSPAIVFVLGLITGGIYSLYWAVKTKGELNARGEKIPTAWIILIPLVGGLYFLWKYSEAVEHVTGNKVSAVVSFLLLWLLGNIGEAILQNYYNEIGEAQLAPAAAAPTNPGVTQAPVAPVSSVAPAESPAPQPASTPETTPPDVTPPTNPIIG